MTSLLLTRATGATAAILVAAMLGLSAVSLASQPDTPRDRAHDAAFDTIPFDKWIAANDRGNIHLNLKVEPAQLSNHQRLRTALLAIVDGKELVKRPATGELTFYAQVTDPAGHGFRTHTSLPLRDVDKETRRADLEYFQTALIAPGDYRLDLAVVHTATGDHGFMQKTFRIDALTDDPLAAAMSNLPSVEFVNEVDPPDRWYLPSLEGRLKLPLETAHSVRVELLVNGTPSELATGNGRLHDLTMSALIPAMKVLSQIDVRNGAMNVSLLDLERRRVTFTQNSVHELDWPRLREALAGTDPNVIDVQSLANRDKNVDFFLGQVSRRVEPAASGDPLQVLIVLSAPMTFAKDVPMHSIDTGTSGKSNTLIFYIRYMPLFGPRMLRGGNLSVGRSRGFGGGGGISGIGRPPGQDIGTPRPSARDDYLERTLKPLSPKLFDVYTPADFRRALAAILGGVARAAQ